MAVSRAFEFQSQKQKKKGAKKKTKIAPYGDKVEDLSPEVLSLFGAHLRTIKSPERLLSEDFKHTSHQDIQNVYSRLVVDVLICPASRRC